MFCEEERIELPDAQIRFYKSCFSSDEADVFFDSLMHDIEWEQGYISLYGRKIKTPREIAWYGDENRTYTFSGTKFEPKPWTNTLTKIKSCIDRVSDVEFNSVLLNRYRNGNDSVSWHSDSEPELGRNPPIGSVSFGATRTFMLKHKRRKIRKNIDLNHGSFLLMTGPTQHFWVHQIPKTSKKTANDVGPRINLTFRRILSIK